jgi:hypothetical protein
MVPQDLHMIILEVACNFHRRAQTMATVSVTSPPPPWHAAYPAPRSFPATIRREDVLDMIKQGAETSSRDYVLVDLRRNDHEARNVDYHLTPPFKELSKPGRHHPRFNQPSCTESVPCHTNPVHALQERRRLQNNLVLLYVPFTHLIAKRHQETPTFNTIMRLTNFGALQPPQKDAAIVPLVGLPTTLQIKEMSR